MSSWVLDSSAILAVSFQEPGRDFVAGRLSGSLLSTVNLQEVLEKYGERNLPTIGAVRRIEQLQVRIVPYSAGHAEIAASLKPVCQPHRVSLADRACLALAKEFGLPVLTADKDWKSIPHGVEVELIR